uniref:Uncharacterized protein n=1 Tax=Ciona savignyi TaxID=51511 RepID=H2YQ90_CIOSA
MLNSCPNLMQKNQIEDIPDLEFDLSLDDILTLSDSLNSTCEFTMHDAPAICRGQPLTKSFPKIISQLKMQLHLQQGADDESGEQEFLIAIQDLEKLSSHTIWL